MSSVLRVSNASSDSSSNSSSNEGDATSSESLNIADSLLKAHATLDEFCFDEKSLSSSCSSPSAIPYSASNNNDNNNNNNNGESEPSTKGLPVLRCKLPENCNEAPIDTTVEDNNSYEFNNETKKRRRLEEKHLKKKKRDVSVHARKASWVAMYGDNRLDKCCVCEFNEVGWTNVGFDMAHVVPRSLDGNNCDAWNRVPTCGTCNGNVSSDTNLLDFVVQHYPHRLIPIVCFLYNRFSHKQPYISNKYFKSKKNIVNLEMFARTLYGTNGLESRFLLKSSDIRGKQNSLVQFLSRSLPDFETKRGRVKDDNVYAILRHYDNQVCEKAKLKEQMQHLDGDIISLQRTLDRMRNIKKEKRAQLTYCRNEIKRLKRT